MASNSNPLGLPLDANGQATTLRLVTIQGDEVRERRIRCNAFCTFLANRPEYVQAFNSLPQQHQIAVLLLQEEWEDRPHLVKERFLQAPIPQRCKALRLATSDDGVENTIRREATLRHLAEFFIQRHPYGALEYMNPETPIFPPLQGYVDRQFDPKRWERKQLTDNLRDATGMLRRKPLSIEDIEDFSF